MSDIEYIVNERGERIKAVIPLDMLNKLLLTEEQGLKNMSNEGLKKYEGSIKLTVDPMKFQKAIRDEWQ